MGVRKAHYTYKVHLCFVFHGTHPFFRLIQTFAMEKIIKTFILLITVWSQLLVQATYATDRPINELPMYGGQHDPQVEPDLKRSQKIAKLGWDYYYKGDLNTAIKRFNQSWMFNRKNVDALWGFGLIMGQRSDEERPEYHLKESIRFLEMALSLQPNNPNILVDLACSYTASGDFLNHKNDQASEEAFIKAESLFEKAEELSPQLQMLHLNWSVLEFSRGDYHKATERLNMAIMLGYKPGSAYEKELKGKLKSESSVPQGPANSTGL